MALVLEHAGGDGGWTDSLLAGLRRRRKPCLCGYAPYSSTGSRCGSAGKRSFARQRQENDLVLVASDRLHEILLQQRRQFPQDPCSVASTRAYALPNIMSITFADEQAAFLGWSRRGHADHGQGAARHQCG